MKQLLSKTFLIVYSLSLVLFLPAEFSFVVSLLIALFLTATIYFFQHPIYSRIITTLFAAGAYLYPPLYYFSPLLCYDMFQSQSYPALFLLAAGIFIRFSGSHTRLLWILILALLLACYLAYSEMAYETLHQHFCKTRDDGTELNLLLEEKNQHLLEKQDYEIYNATLRERNRIAREIHDNVGHMLSRAILLVGAIRTINQDERLTPSLGTLSETLDTAMSNIRTSVHDLHDESVNLKDATENLIHDFTFCPVSLEYDMGETIPREVKYCFISILKEGLSNIMRHSNATHVLILLREHPGFYQMIIHDNGTKKENIYDGGIGLSNMKDRTDNLGGSLQITQKDGFRIFLSIPKTAK